MNLKQRKATRNWTFDNKTWLIRKQKNSELCVICQFVFDDSINATWNDRRVNHHIDGDHNNNSSSNLVCMHGTCHNSYESSGTRNAMYGRGYKLEGDKNPNFGGLSDKHRTNISKSRIGMKLSVTHRKQIGLGMTGRQFSKETNMRRGLSISITKELYAKIKSELIWLEEQEIFLIFEFSLKKIRLTKNDLPIYVHIIQHN